MPIDLRSYQRAFYKVYSPANLDFIDEKQGDTFFSDLSLEEQQKLNDYLNHSRTYWTTFFNVPNNLRKNALITFEDVVKNAVGWQDEGHLARNLFVAPLMGMLLPLRLVAGSVRNILKLVTEYAPAVLITLSDEIAQEVKNDNSMQAQLTNNAAKALSVFFSVWQFIGRAITSPAFGARAAYKLGYDLGQGDNPDKDKQDDYQLAGKILGVTLAFVSIAVSIAFFAFKLPTTFHVSYDLTLKALDYLPDQLATPILVATNALTSVFAPVVSILSDIGFSAILGTAIIVSGLFASPLGKHLIDGVKSRLAPAKKEMATTPSTKSKQSNTITTVLQTLRLVSECVSPIVTSNIIIPQKSADIVPPTLGKQHLFNRQSIEPKSVPELKIVTSVANPMGNS